MRLIVQRVARATVEVDGYVESRIGSGLILSFAVSTGDTFDKARRLATQVMKLKLWPEMLDADKLWSSSVIDNGFEVLVVSQQSLYAAFPKLSPSYDSAIEDTQAQKIFEAFVAQLRKEYQEEMVVAAPFGANLRVESTLDGPAMFELGTDSASSTSRQTVSKAAIKEQLTNTSDLPADVRAVTVALQRLQGAQKSKAVATLEACRIFRVFSLKKFRAALADAAQADADQFAEALDAAAGYFSQKQQDQITTWTGMTITAPPNEDELDEEELAQLRKEVEGEAKKRIAIVKAEPGQVQEPYRPEWGAPPVYTGRAAPNTPAGRQARDDENHPWRSGGGKSGKKGGGKARWGGPRSLGIASLDESLRLHGQWQGEYDYGQLSTLPDAKLPVGARVKEELGNEVKRKGAPLGGAFKRPKGTPTVAPICPGSEEAENEDVWEDL